MRGTTSSARWRCPSAGCVSQPGAPTPGWPARSSPTARGRCRLAGGGVEDWTSESNHAAYCAVGVWHELLVTGDEDFAAQLWPVVKAGIEFAIGLQTQRGEIIWRRHEDSTPDSYALLTGSSSMYSSLRCAIALADHVADPQPDWELAASQLGHAVACHGEAFADKSRFSMDWYYPVLGGAVRGPAAGRLLATGWDTFVVPGLGVRCVSDEPWVTGAETCELAMALDAIGQPDRAMELFEQIQFLRSFVAVTGRAGSSRPASTSRMRRAAGQPPPSCWPPTSWPAERAAAAPARPGSSVTWRPGSSVWQRSRPGGLRLPARLAARVSQSRRWSAPAPAASR